MKAASESKKRERVAPTPTREQLYGVAMMSGASVALVRRVIVDGHVCRYPAVQRAIESAWKAISSGERA